ncbi:DUF2252 domain-containing protein [Tsukamurella sp. 8F]|uniref:DUF2252 domain-containing protein n=1 Tax=unclassified Tsukamurella TaxID=2633480 RepID=UPI0023BA2C13|nr:MULTISPECIES: DUF2252 domain-containing protein [unclassified Tsukamurella]MDF0532210.1 DUF2252 domain-containing protein [Tsukamurella sp. 8J]MDF0588085.1 DUF2252 domain-containing protein [Tsukamurella sp. 8F]
MTVDAPTPSADNEAARRDGRGRRADVPRSAHADLVIDGRDPVAVIERQNETRIPSLVPVRVARMLQSPFAFFRGSAALMAHDLAAGPSTGASVLACGDAHIANFGLFASPERRLLFDLNDFDETGFAPFEWDVKRLAASAVISARDNGFREDQALDAAVDAAREYRATLRSLMATDVLARYFDSVDVDVLLDAAGSKSLKKVVEETAAKARRRTSARVVEKITTVAENGRRHIVADPPLLVPAPNGVIDRFDDVFAAYVRSLRPDAAMVMSQFTVLDVALRVVGVGSVGTRCLIVLLGGPSGETLFLQVKEAAASVLETYGRLGAGVVVPGAPDESAGRHSYRVVAGQQVLQAQSDPFLGWTPTIAGHDYYWRQFRDMKGSVATEELGPSLFEKYCEVCARLLARAHSQSPRAAVAAGYLGKGTRFDEAIGAFAVAYADQNERDYEATQAAVRSGRLVSAGEGD